MCQKSVVQTDLNSINSDFSWW